jgi:iron complex transport system ATP-binding protein
MTIDHRGMGDVVLEVLGVSFVRGDRVILEDIHLEVRRGERWALIGPNGAGKSSLVAMLAAITHPTRGAVRVLGYTLGRVDMRELRRHIGFVEARHPLNRNLPATDVVLTGVTGTVELVPRWAPTAAQRARATELLALLELRHSEDLRWATMSQGERGRTLIARALINDPALLLLDEATTGLDVAAREQLLATLTNLSDSHPDLATLTVTHHFEELPLSTTHAALMTDGRIVAQGIADHVLTTDNVSSCFAHPIEISRHEGRWAARSR